MANVHYVIVYWFSGQTRNDVIKVIMDMGFCLDQKSGIWVKNSRLQLKNANIF
jgi:hypothetical protein